MAWNKNRSRRGDSYNKPKKYTCIVKTKDVTNQFKKWRCNNLLKFVLFLDRAHNGWFWFNVFSNESKNQIASFTKNNRPYNAHV